MEKPCIAFEDAFSELIEYLERALREPGFVSLPNNITKPFQSVFLPNHKVALRPFWKLFDGNKKSRIFRLGPSCLYVLWSILLHCPSCQYLDKALNAFLATLRVYNNNVAAAKILSSISFEVVVPEKVREKRLELCKKLLAPTLNVVLRNDKSISTRRIAARMLCLLAKPDISRQWQSYNHENSLENVLISEEDYVLRLLVADLMRKLVHLEVETKILWRVETSIKQTFHQAHTGNSQWLGSTIELLSGLDTRRVCSDRTPVVLRIRKLEYGAISHQDVDSNIALVIDNEALTVVLPVFDGETIGVIVFPLTKDMAAQPDSTLGSHDENSTSQIAIITYDFKSGYLLNNGNKHALEHIRLMLRSERDLQTLCNLTNENVGRLQPDRQLREEITQPTSPIQQASKQSVNMLEFSLEPEGVNAFLEMPQSFKRPIRKTEEQRASISTTSQIFGREIAPGKKRGEPTLFDKLKASQENQKGVEQNGFTPTTSDCEDLDQQSVSMDSPTLTRKRHEVETGSMEDAIHHGGRSYLVGNDSTLAVALSPQHDEDLASMTDLARKSAQTEVEMYTYDYLPTSERANSFSKQSGGQPIASRTVPFVHPPGGSEAADHFVIVRPIATNGSMAKLATSHSSKAPPKSGLRRSSENNSTETLNTSIRAQAGNTPESKGVGRLPPRPTPQRATTHTGGSVMVEYDADKKAGTNFDEKQPAPIQQEQSDEEDPTNWDVGPENAFRSPGHSLSGSEDGGNNTLKQRRSNCRIEGRGNFKKPATKSKNQLKKSKANDHVQRKPDPPTIAGTRTKRNANKRQPRYVESDNEEGNENAELLKSRIMYSEGTLSMHLAATKKKADATPELHGSKEVGDAAIRNVVDEGLVTPLHGNESEADGLTDQDASHGMVCIEVTKSQDLPPSLECTSLIPGDPNQQHSYGTRQDLVHMANVSDSKAAQDSYPLDKNEVAVLQERTSNSFMSNLSAIAFPLPTNNDVQTPSRLPFGNQKQFVRNVNAAKAASPREIVGQHSVKNRLGQAVKKDNETPNPPEKTGRSRATRSSTHLVNEVVAGEVQFDGHSVISEKNQEALAGQKTKTAGISRLRKTRNDQARSSVLSQPESDRNGAASKISNRKGHLSNVDQETMNQTGKRLSQIRTDQKEVAIQSAASKPVEQFSAATSPRGRSSAHRIRTHTAARHLSPVGNGPDHEAAFEEAALLLTQQQTSASVHRAKLFRQSLATKENDHTNTDLDPSHNDRTHLKTPIVHFITSGPQNQGDLSLRHQTIGSGQQFKSRPQLPLEQVERNPGKAKANSKPRQVSMTTKQNEVLSDEGISSEDGQDDLPNQSGIDLDLSSARATSNVSGDVEFDNMHSIDAEEIQAKVIDHQEPSTVLSVSAPDEERTSRGATPITFNSTASEDSEYEDPQRSASAESSPNRGKTVKISQRGSNKAERSHVGEQTLHSHTKSVVCKPTNKVPRESIGLAKTTMLLYPFAAPNVTLKVFKQPEKTSFNSTAVDLQALHPQALHPQAPRTSSVSITPITFPLTTQTLAREGGHLSNEASHKGDMKPPSNINHFRKSSANQRRNRSVPIVDKTFNTVTEQDMMVGKLRQGQEDGQPQGTESMFVHPRRLKRKSEEICKPLEVAMPVSTPISFDARLHANMRQMEGSPELRISDVPSNEITDNTSRNMQEAETTLVEHSMIRYFEPQSSPVATSEAIPLNSATILSELQAQPGQVIEVAEMVGDKQRSSSRETLEQILLSIATETMNRLNSQEDLLLLAVERFRKGGTLLVKTYHEACNERISYNNRKIRDRLAKQGNEMDTAIRNLKGLQDDVLDLTEPQTTVMLRDLDEQQRDLKERISSVSM